MIFDNHKNMLLKINYDFIFPKMKILVIQQKMIGDVLTCSVLLEILRQNFPQAQLDYLINNNTYAVVKNNPYIDNFILLNPEKDKGFVSIRKLGKKLEQENYDIVIDAYSKISSNLLSYYSKAKTRISFQKWYSDFLYTHTYPRQHTAKTIAGLAIENRMSLLNPLLKKNELGVPPRIYLTQEEIDKAKSYLQKNNLLLTQPIFMISVLGSSPKKTYPQEYMANLINILVDTLDNVQILFNYMPHQFEQAQAIYQSCSPSAQSKIRLDIYGNTLRDFMAITWFCDAIIGNEGGAINIGKALGKKTFSIFSPWIEQENWSIFEDGINNDSVHLKDYFPELYKNILEKKLKKKSIQLYKRLEPSLFKEKYRRFLLNIQKKNIDIKGSNFTSIPPS